MIHYYEILELACAILGLNFDELVDEGRENEIEEALYKKFGIDMEQFCNIVDALLPFTPIVESAFLGQKYHAFINEKERVMIVKVEQKKEDRQ